MRATLLVLVLSIAACGPQTASPSDVPSPSEASPPSSTAPSAASDVTVILTGVPMVADDGGVTWCPGIGENGCAGIEVTGVMPDAIPPAPGDEIRLWQVEGRFDGQRLAASGPPERVDSPTDDFSTPCEGLRGEHDVGGNMDPAAADAVAGYVGTIPDRYAGEWWDGEVAVLTVLLTGEDVADHRAALEDAVGDRGTVCVVGGARHSLAELQRAQERATEIAMDAGMGLWSSGVDVVANRVDLEVERSDEPSRRRIRREVGDMVRIHAFMALSDATLAQLPAPPPAGDVELETAGTRGGGGMDALGVFTVRFDADRRCVYGEFGGERVGLLWPFGYYATADPLQVFDQDGQLVAREGDQLTSGGGHAPREGSAVCGTSDVWVMNGRPEVMGASPSPSGG
jgi:hypothetical protein